jgi:hypothetical protein
MSEHENGKELKVIFSPELTAEIHNLAERRGYSDIEYVRLALGLMKKAVEVEEQDHQLIVATRDGEVITQLVLSEPQGMKSVVQKILDEHRISSLDRTIADLDPDIAKEDNKRFR